MLSWISYFLWIESPLDCRVDRVGLEATLSLFSMIYVYSNEINNILELNFLRVEFRLLLVDGSFIKFYHSWLLDIYSLNLLIKRFFNNLFLFYSVLVVSYKSTYQKIFSCFVYSIIEGIGPWFLVTFINVNYYK